ncbi:segregation/condensation protein A [Parachlamydia sp. AcF125]|uniref:segregation and condensation protein A n=1 Tax=Parachlamydia sp. AcF125 TaxID=2795736 RepID=UPI001BD80A45|nr:segregation/condensation protein A [Parachlamydia sp. AcF125]MBS4168245.1 Segregation and condensation protein A [Parachlamydia sp. AcF125]
MLGEEIILSYADCLVCRERITVSQETFEFENFTGSLEFLLHLIQKNEIDICEISLRHMTSQYLGKVKDWQDTQIDRGTDFIATAASLLWMKSKTLLPKHEQAEEEILEIEDPHFEIIHHLVDYCRFKEAAKELVERGEAQHAYSRGAEPSEVKKGMGLAHLSLTDLAALFQQALTKFSAQTKVVQEEVWRVSDKIRYLRIQLKEVARFLLGDLLACARSREELIVTFLAVLELMKLGELAVFKEVETNLIIMSSPSSTPDVH